MSITYNGKSVLAIYRNGTAVEQALIAWNWTPTQLYFGGARGAAYVPDTGDVYGPYGLAAFGENISAVLDEKNGTPVLGPDLVANGTFETSVTGWASGYSAVVTRSGQTMLVTNGATDPSRAVAPISTVIGKSYRISGTILAGSNAAAFISASNSGNGSGEFGKSSIGPGDRTSFFTATATTTYVVAATGVMTSGATAYFDNISVREVPGNYALQASTSPRPLLGQAPASRRNLLTYTEQFDNNAWGKVGTTVPSTQYLAPDGTTTAELFLPDTASSQHYMNAPTAASVLGTHTLSYYVKANGANFVQIAFGSSSNPNNARINYDLAGKAVGTTSAGLTGSIVELPGGDGWFRITCVVDIDASPISHTIALIQTAADARLPVFTGDGTSGILIWGAQLELGSVATSYQRVGTTLLDMTESGVASYPFIRMDLSDDALTTSGLVSTKNLIKYTEEFDNVTWTKENSIVVQSNMAIAPDGTMSADKLLEKAATQQHRFYQSVPSLTVPRVFSVYLKQAERTWAYLEFANGAFAFFNLATGETGAIGGTGITSSISAASNGFYRCEIRTSGTYGVECRIAVTTGNSVFSYLGDGTSGIFVWGAQFEAGSVATAYEYGGFKGTALVAGRNGSTFDSITLPDGNFTLGPTGVTSGTPGLLRAVGDIVGYNLINKTLTAKERKYLIQYYKDRGAKGLLTYGPELITNGGPFINTTGWALVNANMSIEDTWLRATATSATQPIMSFIIATDVGRPYRLLGDWQSSTGTTWRLVVGTSAGGNQIGSVTAVQTGKFNDIFLATTTSTYVSLRGVTGMATGVWSEINNMSVKELRPEEEWV